MKHASKSLFMFFEACVVLGSTRFDVSFGFRVFGLGLRFLSSGKKAILGNVWGTGGIHREMVGSKVV
jgi:hypothetical protein